MADNDEEYAAIINIDLTEITEPILCAPNDPDNVRLLSEAAGTQIDEVFIGSCMTNIAHFRAAGKIMAQTGEIPTRLWLADFLSYHLNFLGAGNTTIFLIVLLSIITRYLFASGVPMSQRWCRFLPPLGW